MMNVIENRSSPAGNIYGREQRLFGLQIGVMNACRGIVAGAQIGIANEASRVAGAQLLGAANTARVFDGMQLAWVFNTARPRHPFAAQKSCGLQIAAWNDAADINGLQLGVVNIADKMTGVQIGLVNIIKESSLPFLPVVNACF
jgi:hypothetical protein